MAARVGKSCLGVNFRNELIKPQEENLLTKLVRLNAYDKVEAT